MAGSQGMLNRDGCGKKQLCSGKEIENKYE